MKTIKITAKLKQDNPRVDFVVNNPVEKIVIATIPNLFNNFLGGYSLRTDLHENDGWKDLIFPTYNSETQKLGSEIVELNGEHTYQTIDLTPEEVLANAQVALDNDASATMVNDRRADGQLYYKRRMDAIERAYYDDLLSVEPILFANRYFDEALAPLTRGNWASTQSALLITPTIPSSYTPTEIQILTTFYQEIVNEVNDYVTETYSKL